MCKDAPDPDPLIGQAAKANAEIAKESLDFYKSVYQDQILPLMKADQETRAGLIEDMRATMKKQDARADEQQKIYTENYLPTEKRAIADAEGYDSDENVNRRMGIASANVNQQFSNAREQSARALSRYGLNPNSSAFARENAKLTNSQALSAAGAQTGAAFDTMDKGIALRAGVADRARGVTGTIGNFLNSTAATGGATGNVSAQGMGVASQGAGVMGQGFGYGIQGNQSAGNLALGDFSARMQGYQADQAATGALFQGIGMAGGAWMGTPQGKRIFAADGGHIDGPGGPRDDKVPAMLSAGEFVLNEGAVKHFGLAKLHKMNEAGLKNQASRGLIRSA
jgi:hypothetical protein